MDAFGAFLGARADAAEGLEAVEQGEHPTKIPARESV